ncbi:18253_t:CDS:2, partial [Racocetra persica]
EKEALINSSEFAEFFENSAKLVQEVLNDRYDLLIDYSLIEDEESKHRSVTDVNFSKKTPERVVASYNKNSFAKYEPDGIVLVWNLRQSERPEFVLHSQ